MSSLGKMLLLKAPGVEVILKFLAHRVKLLTFQHPGQGKGFLGTAVKEKSTRMILFRIVFLIKIVPKAFHF